MSVVNKKSLHIFKNYITGQFRCSEFALTNACIAKCSFCSIWKQKPKIFVDFEKACDAINRLADFGVSHMCFTGGEALMHPNVVELVTLASKRKINNAMLIAAPSLLLRNDMIKRLEDAGCDLLSISFDSGDPETMARSRQIPTLIDDMKRALEEVSKTSLKTMASVLIWNENHDKLEEVYGYALELGYDFISLNYPTFSESSVYELGGEGISFPREHLITALEQAIEFKRAKKYPIINPASTMQNIVDYLKEPKSARFPCKGGSRVFFLDWFFDLYPCMQLEKPLGNIFELSKKDFYKESCNACNMSWYRDISAFFHGTRSIPLLLEAMTSSGKVLKK